MGSAPKYEQKPLGEAFANLSQQAMGDDIAATQQNTRFDTASLLARYGRNLTLAGAGGAGLPNADAGGFPLKGMANG